MRVLLRIARGAFRNAVLWAGGWGTLSVGLLGTMPLFGLPLRTAVSLVGPVFLGGAAAGFVCGAVFSGLLAIIYRERQISAMRPLWFALLGAGTGVMVLTSTILVPVTLAGWSLPALPVFGAMAVVGGIGAVASTTMLRVAQRGLEPPTTDPLLVSGD